MLGTKAIEKECYSREIRSFEIEYAFLASVFLYDAIQHSGSSLAFSAPRIAPGGHVIYSARGSEEKGAGYQSSIFHPAYGEGLLHLSKFFVELC